MADAGSRRVAKERRAKAAARPPRPKPTSRQGSSSLLVVFGFCALLGGLVLLGSLPAVLVLVYLGVSLITFCLYAWDKSAARRGAWRTPENTLHLWSLLGGWPGALLAQQFLRHKSVKAGFRSVFWVTVLFNVAVLAWLASPAGRSWLGGLA